MSALALGYEGPETVGGLVAAAAILIATILITMLVIRWLVGWAVTERRPGSSGPRRPAS